MYYYTFSSSCSLLLYISLRSLDRCTCCNNNDEINCDIILLLKVVHERKKGFRLLLSRNENNVISKLAYFFQMNVKDLSNYILFVLLRASLYEQRRKGTCSVILMSINISSNFFFTTQQQLARNWLFSTKEGFLKLDCFYDLTFSVNFIPAV